MYNISILVIILLIIHLIYRKQKQIKEGYFGTFQFHPYLNYIGIIYSSTLPQKVFALYELYDGIHSKFEYYYRYIDSYYYNYEFIQIPTEYDLTDGCKVKIDNSNEVYTVNLRFPYKRIAEDIRIFPGSVFHYNPVYDRYHNILYKRPVHYSVSGDFVTSIGKYGILVPVKDKEDKPIIDGDRYSLYEKEIDPSTDKYKYYIENNDQYVEINRTTKIIDKEIIQIDDKYYMFMIN
jgi:hypothetical protein